MNRCLRTAAIVAAGGLMGMAAALPTAQATTAPPLVPLAFARQLPPTSLRGEITVINSAEVLLNGKADRLAPGVRIRGTNNMLVMPGAAIGQKLIVNYTREGYGLIQDVWVLRPDEIQKRWPKTPAEAAKWTFDPVTQTWTP